MQSDWQSAVEGSAGARALNATLPGGERHKEAAVRFVLVQQKEKLCNGLNGKGSLCDGNVIWQWIGTEGSFERERGLEDNVFSSACCIMNV